MIAYKATDKDVKCNGFQFKLGEIYTHEGELELCYSGFLFCRNPACCFDYYDKPNSRLFKIEVLGEIKGDPADKEVTNKLKFVEEITIESLFDVRNNVGNWNTCDHETGFFNTISPKKIRVFNKECNVQDFNNCKLPNFVFFSIKDSNYKKSFYESWKQAPHADKIKLKNIPNFDIKIFSEISGIPIEELKKELTVSEE